jgi:hypothetical protein
LFFRAKGRVYVSFGYACIPRCPLQRRLDCETLLQREVVGNPKKPTPKVLTGTTQVKMTKERQEYLLQEFFRIVNR